MYSVDISEMVGKTFTKVFTKDNEEVHFVNSEGSYVFLHYQDCCESVTIEDICGDLEDLQDHELLMAEESSGDMGDTVDSGTWTFYKFSTILGSVTIRWIGMSNGYYSESVSLEYRKST